MLTNPEIWEKDDSPESTLVYLISMIPVADSVVLQVVAFQLIGTRLLLSTKAVGE